MKLSTALSFLTFPLSFSLTTLEASSPAVGETLEYKSWLLQHFSEQEQLDQGIVGEHADPDQDGQSNGFEFLANLDPKDNSSRFHFGYEDSKREYLRFGPNNDEVVYAIEYSSLLKNWIAIDPTALLPGGDSLRLSLKNHPAEAFYRVGISRIDRSPNSNDFTSAPAGTYTMGSPNAEIGRGSGEIRHQVEITKNLLVGGTEVTNYHMAYVLNWALQRGFLDADSQSVTVVGDESQQQLLSLNDPDCQISFNGILFVVEDGKGDFPCIEVTWHGAMAFCHYLTQKDGEKSQAINLSDWTIDFTKNGYRLPTEAEWEYLSRAGTTTAFYTGDITGASVDPNLDKAGWYNDNSEGATHEVAGKQANVWGLFDTHGNVWEWCSDWHSSSLGSENVVDPNGPDSGSRRVIRGGSWSSLAQDSRAAFRDSFEPGKSHSTIGFRVVSASVPQL
ncbi:formylglycine-generating enzyme family protein [Pelagicoccus mobilis]|uniref:Formylglycine-generating enzyme family protein n=1 Tax=Pelagicoccus mobilis TaxID=415221 RepID=A0A934VR01_9BACT|nr:formylglycine-generating enzyme family protein [Pelagicoccus mobilis]MBK1877430.1 formylglycine-generating enzyme family protein [Pelagicoccus mobilis]